MSERKGCDTPLPLPLPSPPPGLDATEYERKLVRKLDRNIVPVVMVLYLLSFLDRWVASPGTGEGGGRLTRCAERVNIGSARLYGLEEDLGLVGNQFQLVGLVRASARGRRTADRARARCRLCRFSS